MVGRGWGIDRMDCVSGRCRHWTRLWGSGLREQPAQAAGAAQRSPGFFEVRTHPVLRSGRSSLRCALGLAGRITGLRQFRAAEVAAQAADVLEEFLAENVARQSRGA